MAGVALAVVITFRLKRDHNTAERLGKTAIIRRLNAIGDSFATSCDAKCFQ